MDVKITERSIVTAINMGMSTDSVSVDFRDLNDITKPYLVIID